VSVRGGDRGWRPVHLSRRARGVLLLNCRPLALAPRPTDESETTPPIVLAQAALIRLGHARYRDVPSIAARLEKVLEEHVKRYALGAPSVAGFLAGGLTEMYLCNPCSCHEILRRNGRG
jgi:hypothetical protein